MHGRTMPTAPLLPHCMAASSWAPSSPSPGFGLKTAGAMSVTPFAGPLYPRCNAHRRTRPLFLHRHTGCPSKDPQSLPESHDNGAASPAPGDSRCHALFPLYFHFGSSLTPLSLSSTYRSSFPSLPATIRDSSLVNAATLKHLISITGVDKPR
jgi:hypothetical protein